MCYSSSTTWVAIIGFRELKSKVCALLPPELGRGKVDLVERTGAIYVGHSYLTCSS